jgi:hypothetical protein
VLREHSRGNDDYGLRFVNALFICCFNRKTAHFVIHFLLHCKFMQNLNDIMNIIERFFLNTPVHSVLQWIVYKHPRLTSAFF